MPLPLLLRPLLLLASGSFPVVADDTADDGAAETALSAEEVWGEGDGGGGATGVARAGLIRECGFVCLDDDVCLLADWLSRQDRALGGGGRRDDVAQRIGETERIFVILLRLRSSLAERRCGARGRSNAHEC